MSLLRAELIKAREYAKNREKEDVSKHPARDLGLEALTAVLAREKPLLITAHRSQDIANALRLAEEFKFKLILDGAAEAYLLIDLLKAAEVPIIVHPTMARATGERENRTFENAALLRQAGLLEVGKDGDLALYDGDPFEYTSHCIGVVIEGTVVSQEAR